MLPVDALDGVCWSLMLPSDALACRKYGCTAEKAYARIDALDGG
jgi:hypothetical protein